LGTDKTEEAIFVGANQTDMEVKYEPQIVTLEGGKQYCWSNEVGKGLEPNENAPEEVSDGLYFYPDRPTAYICTCKQTKNPPYCDGSHKTLNEV
jgi:hypothetical protein